MYIISRQVLAHKMKDTFLYFAYGSNLLTERIHINNKSAEKVAVARLEGYGLTFNMYGKRWHGAAATIIEDKNSQVWGVVWEIKNSDMPCLDRQEFGYDPLTVKVKTADGQQLECRTYMMSSPMTDYRLPSTVYKNVIVKGAIENGLPEDYIAKLQKIEDNGYNGPVGINLSDMAKG